MPVFKNEANNSWYVMARYTDWKGERKQKCKRGLIELIRFIANIMNGMKEESK